MLLFLGLSQADALTLKVASIAPQNSSWGRILESVSSRFNSSTNGEVKLRIFHGGIAGNEADVLRKVRLGQLDIAVLSSIGIALIDKAALSISAPGLISGADELEYVLQKVGPALKRKVNESPYEVLGWSGIGWIYPFANKPIRSPEEFRGIRIGTSSGDESISKLYRDNGINPVLLPFSEWLTSLNSGLIEGFLSSPTAAAGFQWFGIANYMTNIQVAPFLGALVISDRAWSRVDRKHRSVLKAIVADALKTLTKESVELERRSIEIMRRFGLNVVEISSSEQKEWSAFFDLDQGKISRTDLGKIFDVDMYDAIKSALAEYRSR